MWWVMSGFRRGRHEVFERPEFVRCIVLAPGHHDLAPVRADIQAAVRGVCWKTTQTLRLAAARRHAIETVFSRGIDRMVDQPVAVGRNVEVARVGVRKQGLPIATRGGAYLEVALLVHFDDPALVR